MEKKPRGFAALDLETRRAIASLGGATAHRNGNAHRFTTKEARIAGKKGGSSPRTMKNRPDVAP